MNARMTTRIVGAAGMVGLGVIAGLALGQARRLATKAAMRLTGDWERQMKAEHRALIKLTRSLADARIEEAPKRAALVSAVEDLLARHAMEEENVVYPALRAAGLESAVAAQLQDHADMRLLLRELEGMPPEAPGFADAAGKLKDLIDQHIRQEEHDLFPRLREGAAEGDTVRLTHLVRREGMRVS